MTGEQYYEKWRFSEVKVRKLQCDQAILFVLIGLFVFPSFIREIFARSIYELNFFALIGCIFIAYKRSKSGQIKCQNQIIFWLGFFLFILLAFSEMKAGRSIKGYFRVSGGLLVPLLLIYYVPTKNQMETISTIVKAFKVVTTMIVFFGIVDLLLSHKLSFLYYSFVGDTTYATICLGKNQINRMFSYLGHPLYNAEIIQMGFVLNYLYSELFAKNHKKDIFVIAVSLVGITLTASKTAIVIFLLLLCTFYIKKIRYTLLIGIGILCAYVNGFFNYIIERFSTGSLTSGRDSVWETLNDGSRVFFHFFWGNGSDSKYKYNSIVAYASAAFEYPFRLLSLEFGVLFCIVFMLLAFVYPMVCLFRKRANLFLIMGFLAIILQVNTYNGIGTYNDHMYMYALFAFCINNMALQIQR